MNFTKALSEGLARAKAEIEADLDETLEKAVDAGERVMKSRVPVDSGDLRDSIRREDTRDVRRIRVSSDHAIAVEFGTSDTQPSGYWRAGVAAIRQGVRPKRVTRRVDG